MRGSPFFACGLAFLKVLGVVLKVRFAACGRSVRVREEVDGVVREVDWRRGVRSRKRGLLRVCGGMMTVGVLELRGIESWGEGCGVDGACLDRLVDKFCRSVETLVELCDD
jgi:hypothetical protein